MTFKIANSSGALLITKKEFEKLSPAMQKLLKTRTEEFSKKLIAASRKDNETAYETLKKNNIVFIDLQKGEYEKIFLASQKTWNELAGKLYPKALLDDALKYKEEYKKLAKKK